MNPSGYIRQLEETIIRITVERDEAIKRVRELEKRLAFYENPHTPPSAKASRKTKKTSVVNAAPKKRGAPKGHRGATRKRPEPDEVIDVTMDVCPGCDHKLGGPVRTETRVIEDMPPPQVVKVTQYNVDIYECPHCGLEVTAKHPDCPRVGNFGIYLLVYITMLKYHLRGVLRKIQDFMSYNHNFDISVKGVHDILLRVGDVCKEEYDRKLAKIRNARWRYIDETGFKVNGEKWWLWIFRTDEDDTLVVIRKSRGRKVLDEILGEDHNGPDVVDGWRAYNRIGTIQRCWAHLIREVDEFKDVSENGKQLSEEVHTRYDELNDFLDKDPPIEERIQQKEVLDREMEELVKRYSIFRELKKPMTYIQNGLGSWYTCVLYPGMEPTNNLGEQAMREHVIMRKIIGCFRSENGAKNYQYIASLLASWKLQDKNGFVELEQLLRRELCLS